MKVVFLLILFMKTEKKFTNLLRCQDFRRLDYISKMLTVKEKHLFADVLQNS